MTTDFAQLLSNLLYSTVELRPAILKGMRLLVDSAVAAAAVPKSDNTPRRTSKSGSAIVSLSPLASDPNEMAQAAKNIQFLKSQGESWLAVYFNLYGSLNNAGKDSNTRNLVGEVIAVWASISSAEQITNAYGNVLGLFKNNLPTPNEHKATADHTTLVLSLDIIIQLLPHLSPTQLTEVLNLALLPAVLGCKDNAVVKRAYRLSGKIVETRAQELSEFSAVTVLEQLNSIGDEGVGAGNGGAKRVRLNIHQCSKQLISFPRIASISFDSWSPSFHLTLCT